MKQIFGDFRIGEATIACLLSAFAFCHSHSQSTFVRTFGSTGEDGASCVIQTPDGNFVMAGLANDMPYPKISLLVKFDTNGDTIWTKTVNYILDERAYNIINTSDGGLLMMGEGKYCVNGNCGTDGYLVKMNANGEPVWSRGYGATLWDDITDAGQLSDGTFVLAGETVSAGAGSYDMFIMKVSSTGDTLWHKTFGGVGQDYCPSVLACNDGGFLLTGSWRDTSQFTPAIPILIKTNSSGELVWAKEYQMTSDLFLMDADEISDGYIIMAQHGMMKTDKLGNLIWFRHFVEFDAWVMQNFYGKMNQTASGDFLLAGKHYDGSGTYACIVKADSTGNIIWAKKFGSGTSFEVAADVIETSDGRILACGTTLSYGMGAGDAFVLMTDANGELSTCTSTAAITNSALTPVVNAVSPSVGKGLWVGIASFDANRPAVPDSTICLSMVPVEDIVESEMKIWYSDGRIFIDFENVESGKNIYQLRINDMKGQAVFQGILPNPGTEMSGMEISLAVGLYIATCESELGNSILKFAVQQ